MPQLYDITPPVSPELPVWPGDTPLTREILCDLAEGASVTLSTMRATMHLGAHADGPNHYAVDGAGIGERDLRFYLGPCVVVRVIAERRSRVQVQQVRERLEQLQVQLREGQAGDARLDDGLPQRVLIDTGTFPDAMHFNEDFAGLSPELVDYLHGLGVMLIGIDAPSVDLIDSKELPAHKRFHANDMAILETLMLRDVPEGVYELIALPLKLMGFDASPVRAVLRPLAD